MLEEKKRNQDIVNYALIVVLGSKAYQGLSSVRVCLYTVVGCLGLFLPYLSKLRVLGHRQR